MTNYSPVIFMILLITSSCINRKAPQPIAMKSETVNNNAFLDSLEHDLETEYSKGHLPGFALSIFTSEKIIFQKGYGYANIEEKKEMNTNTVQGIASISKTLIAVSLMKAVELQKIGLDDHINDILPFPVIHPQHKDIPITIRQLATHSSSISDDGQYRRSYVFEETLDKDEFPPAWTDHIASYNQNKSMKMETFLEQLFHADGAWNTEQNFTTEKPGTSYEYSNIGAALLAYCIQLSMDEDYRELTQKWILDPLHMDRSGWSASTVDQYNHIAYYNEIYNPVPAYSCITYPDGGLYSTVHDLTIFMQEMMKGYQGKSKLLTKASFREMMRNQIPDTGTATGLIWDLDIDCCIGHGGNDFGLATLMYFSPDSGIGKILFTNISLEKEEIEDQFYSIFNALFKYDSEIETFSE